MTPDLMTLALLVGLFIGVLAIFQLVTAIRHDQVVTAAPAIVERDEVVRQIDTTGVPPTASVIARQAADRPDAVSASLDREEVLAAAPDAAADAGFFKVPRVIG